MSQYLCLFKSLMTKFEAVIINILRYPWLKWLWIMWKDKRELSATSVTPLSSTELSVVCNGFYITCLYQCFHCDPIQSRPYQEISGRVILCINECSWTFYCHFSIPLHYLDNLLKMYTHFKSKKWEINAFKAIFHFNIITYFIMGWNLEEIKRLLFFPLLSKTIHIF